MFVSGLSSAPIRDRDELRSHILLQAGDADGVSLAVTWVEVAPGGLQRPHRHEPQQVYVLLSGRGRMRIDDEERELLAGELVFIPAGAVHGIENTGEEKLVYVSAATPAFDLTGLYDTGQLRSTDSTYE
ncbi:MAG: cupin domain-containing protein [Solirubrobacteraceae bacterium]